MTHQSTPARGAGTFSHSHTALARRALTDFACRSVLLLVDLMTWRVGRTS